MSSMERMGESGEEGIRGIEVRVVFNGKRRPNEDDGGDNSKGGRSNVGHGDHVLRQSTCVRH